MLILPNELCYQIIRMLEDRDLWALSRTSRRLRNLSIFPFLARHNISEEQIRSGTLCVPVESSFLVIVAAHIHPLRKLEVLRRTFPAASPWALPSVLAAVPPIPDLMLHSSYGQFKDRLRIAKILSASCLGAKPTFVFIGRGTVSVSAHRNIRPLRWKWIPHPTIYTASEFTLRRLLSDCLLLLPLTLAYLLSGIINIGVVAAWMYRNVRGVQWDRADRIAADMGSIHGAWMHAQSLLAATAEQFTLVTFGSDLSMFLTIPRLPVLTDAQRSILLSTLELPEFLIQLTIAESANAILADVMKCVHRHPRLTSLVFEPHSILPASIVNLPLSSPGRITALTAPAAYIPFILLAEPNIQHLSITFPTTSPDRVAFDIPTCLRALNGIASLPGTHPITLALSFTKASIVARALPWHVRSVPIPLPRVSTLTLFADGAPGAALDIALLVPWLAASFPAVIRIGAPDGSDDTQIEEALREARQDGSISAGSDMGSP
ncbi:hypothetical protein FB451DRAFT_1172336 [Mycena latifolia]|nr:hypothetical protein FB451DRAFT_1172336 [Mycena latifolia]